MKILHVIRGLANSSGTTHIVGPLAEAQARLGEEVTVFFVEKPGQSAVIPDRTIVSSTEFPLTIPSRHYGWSLAFARALRQSIQEFDLVHIHAIWNFPTWCTMRVAARHGVPYLVAPQGSLDDWALGRSRRFKSLYSSMLEKRWFDRAASMQALTRTEADQCRRFGIRAAVAVLPNGVDLNVLDRACDPADIRAELGLPAGEKLLLFLGRIFPKKGLDLLAQAFGKLVAQRSDVTLLIAGHDAGSGYRDEVSRLLDRAGAGNKARFLGEVNGSSKFELLRAADLFVLSSYSEGLPVAVVEAMGVGLPVVITPGCNLPEVAEAEAGWITGAEVASLSETFDEAFYDSDELARRGRNGRHLVEERFTWPLIAERSIELYRAMLNSPSVTEPHTLASTS